MDIDYTILHIDYSDIHNASNLFGGEHRIQSIFNKHYLVVDKGWNVDVIVHTLNENGIAVLQVTPVTHK